MHTSPSKFSFEQHVRMLADDCDGNPTEYRLLMREGTKYLCVPVDRTRAMGGGVWVEEDRLEDWEEWKARKKRVFGFEVGDRVECVTGHYKGAHLEVIEICDDGLIRAKRLFRSSQVLLFYRNELEGLGVIRNESLPHDLGLTREQAETDTEFRARIMLRAESYRAEGTGMIVNLASLEVIRLAAGQRLDEVGQHYGLMRWPATAALSKQENKPMEKTSNPNFPRFAPGGEVVCLRLEFRDVDGKGILYMLIDQLDERQVHCDWMWKGLRRTAWLPMDELLTREEAEKFGLHRSGSVRPLDWNVARSYAVRRVAFDNGELKFKKGDQAIHRPKGDSRFDFQYTLTVEGVRCEEDSVDLYLCSWSEMPHQVKTATFDGETLRHPDWTAMAPKQICVGDVVRHISSSLQMIVEEVGKMHGRYDRRCSWPSYDAWNPETGLIESRNAGELWFHCNELQKVDPKDQVSFLHRQKISLLASKQPVVEKKSEPAQPLQIKQDFRDHDPELILAPHQKALVNRKLTDKDGYLCRELIFPTRIGTCGKAMGMFVEKLVNQRVVSVKITRTDVIVERFLFCEDMGLQYNPLARIRFDDVALPDRTESQNFGKVTVDQVEDAWQKIRKLIEHLIEEATREFHVHPFTAKMKSK